MSTFAFHGSLKKTPYFEGWYYKNITVDNKITLSIIPGVSITKEDPHAFIQVIENIYHKTYYIRYRLEDVKIHENPDCFQIADNYFYEDYIDLAIENDDLKLNGFLYYSDLTRIKMTKLSPTIMGPFSHLPFMECNHSIISMHHYIDGILTLNDDVIDFEDGTGYIEKDYGVSFPKEYLWLQSNTLAKQNLDYKKASIFLSIADIPFKIFHFKGFICVFTLNDREYRFATYNGAKVTQIHNKSGICKIALIKGNYKLILRVQPKHALPLISPKAGNMQDTILESLDSVCHVTLYQKKKILFKQKMIACGYEKK